MERVHRHPAEERPKSAGLHGRGPHRARAQQADERRHRRSR